MEDSLKIVPNLSFKYLEDKQWFDLLLQGVENRENLFDFRDPQIKREEYNLIKHQLKLAKIAKIGKVCELHIAGVCHLSSGLVLDHLIPLSSNELNKQLRKMKGFGGKKVQSESYGSNHPMNLSLACKSCNSHKKHLFLNSKDMINILRVK
jgi:hypothetical protein